MGGLCLEFRDAGLGTRVWGLGMKVWGLGFRDESLGFSVYKGVGMKVWGMGFRGLGFRDSDLGLRGPSSKKSYLKVPLIP